MPYIPAPNGYPSHEAPLGDPVRDRFYDLRMGGHQRSEADRAELLKAARRHEGYLAGVAHSLEAQAAGSGMVVQQFNEGDKTAFGATNDVPDAPLDPEKLGLPAFTRADQTPLAVVLHDNPTKEGHVVGAIGLMARDNRTGALHEHYLESTAAIDETRGRAPAWRGAGGADLSTRSVDLLERDTVGNQRTKQSMQTVEAVKIEYYGADQPAQARIVRPKPTRAEVRAAGAHEEGWIRRNMRKLGVTALVAAGLATAPFFHKDNPDADLDLKNPDQMIMREGYHEPKNGVRQAEMSYDKKTLDRSREAFAAYARGDKAALQAEAAQYGYEKHWIPESTFEAVRNAKSPAEITAAFNGAMKDLPVQLKIGSENISESHFSDGDYTFAPSKSLDDQKKMATGILNIFNLLDKSGAQQKIRPLEYVLIGHVTVENKRDKKASDPAGYFLIGNERHVSQIVLGTDYSDQAERIAAHETSHAYSDTGVIGDGPESMNARINTLNPADHRYYGNDWPKSPQYVKGNKVVDNLYGNDSEEEDLAVTGEALLVDQPVIVAKESTYLEKQQSFILAMEEAFPGFTAALLEHADVQYPTTAEKTTDNIIEAVWSVLESGQLINAGAAALILLGVAASEIRRRSEISQLRKYGVVPASAGQLVMSYDQRTGRYEPVKPNAGTFAGYR